MNLCCKSHTHAANIKCQPNACSSRFKQYFPFLLSGENIHNYFIKSIVSSHYQFIKSIASSRCVEDTPGNTLVHTLAHDKYSPAPWVSRKLRPKSKQFRVIPRIASSRLVNCSSIHWPKLKVSGSATWLPIFVSRNCQATDIALTERLDSNGF